MVGLIQERREAVGALPHPPSVPARQVVEKREARRLPWEAHRSTGAELVPHVAVVADAHKFLVECRAANQHQRWKLVDSMQLTNKRRLHKIRNRGKLPERSSGMEGSSATEGSSPWRKGSLLGSAGIFMALAFLNPPTIVFSRNVVISL